MKQILFKICCLCMFLNLSAQTTDVINSGLIGPIYLARNGDDLFISEFLGDRISKINISGSTAPNLTVVATGFDGPQGLLMDGNTLYIAESEGGEISSIDITQSSPVKTTILTGLSYPTGLAIKDNELYIAELNGNKISKIDLSEMSPVKQDVVTNLNGPTGMALNNNDLFIVEQPIGRISKVNLSSTSLPTTTTQTVVTGLQGPYKIKLSDENELFISEYFGNIISKINITDPIPTTATLVQDNIGGPAGTYLIGDELYITELNAAKLTKLTLQTLSNTALEQQEPIFVYPNPAKDFLYVDKKFANSNYKIYDILGNLVKDGVLSEQSNVLISELSKGTYFLSLKHQQKPIKFLKN